MGLQEIIGSVLTTAEKLKTSTAGNEANTKALLIEPLLAALGWDLGDLDAVEREVKVYQGTFLDYALKVDSVPRIYLEAKGIAENLSDKKFIAQTVNYANNDGVLWCVLTNGLRYRVYKTNEPVAMEQKLLLEVDLTDGSEPLSEKLKLLRSISRDAVADGSLDALGERVFTDTRVRKALAELAGAPSAEFVGAIADLVGHPTVHTGALKRSLVRILDAPTVISKGTISGGSELEKRPIGPSGPPKGQEYGLNHHFDNKSSLIRELWEDIDNYASSLGPEVSRRVRKFYIGYFRGKRSFFTAEIQKGRVLIYVSLSKDSAQPWDDEVMRDVSDIGHFGMGDTEYSLVTVDQLAALHALISLAYLAVDA